MIKIQTFLAIGGPLDGHTVTEDYAGDEYNRFNNAGGVSYKMKPVRYGKGPGCVGLVYVRDETGKKIIKTPACVLIHDSIFDKLNQL